jgi:hypothetical protein
MFSVLAIVVYFLRNLGGYGIRWMSVILSGFPLRLTVLFLLSGFD